MPIPSYKAGKLDISPGLVLSPMSGVTTSAFRRLVKELNPGAVGLLVSEFISVEAMSRKVPRSLAMMNYDESERPYGIQIFGYDIDRMRDAALMVQDAGADLVDINCGCPAPKVVRKGGGCELMRQPEHLRQLVRTVRAAVTIPMTIKIRAGWDANSRNALEVAKIAEGEGVDAIAIHGRTRAQMYRGDADWDLVAAIAREIRVPVLGSGDVVCRASALDRLARGVSGLFIGRAALWNPLIFSEITGGSPERSLKSDSDLVLRILERYMDLLRMEFRPSQSIGKFKQLASQMCRGYTWRKDLCTAMTLDEQIEILRKLRDNGAGAMQEQQEKIVEQMAPNALDCSSYQ